MEAASRGRSPEKNRKPFNFKCLPASWQCVVVNRRTLPRVEPAEHLHQLSRSLVEKKHAKRRIVNDVFAELLVSRLVPGGHLLIQTDVASLLEGYIEAFEPFTELRNKAGPFRLFPFNPSGARSHREKKCVNQEIPIFRVLYEKTTVHEKA